MVKKKSWFSGSGVVFLQRGESRPLYTEFINERRGTAEEMNQSTLHLEEQSDQVAS